MNKGGLITAGMFALMDAAGEILAGVVFLVADDYYDEESAGVDFTTIAVLMLVGAGIWITTTVLVFVFACGRIHQYDNAPNMNGQNQNNLPVATPETVVPIPPNTALVQKGGYPYQTQPPMHHSAARARLKWMLK